MTQLLSGIRAKLAALPTFNGVEIRQAFSGLPLPAAPLTPMVVIGFGAISLSGFAAGDRLADGRLGKRRKSTVKFQLISPALLGAERCTALFKGLCEALLFDGELSILSMTGAEIRFNAERRAYEMTATATAEDLFYKP